MLTYFDAIHNYTQVWVHINNKKIELEALAYVQCIRTVSDSLNLQIN
jgi:hypothetical protein